MRNPFPIEKLGRKLLLRGLPPREVSKAVRELSEHWEDLRDEASAQGLSENEAKDFADKSLGDTETLADCITRQMQQSNWIGRHQVVSFCLLPLVAIVLWWVMFAFVSGWATGALQWSNDKSLPQPNWNLVVGLFDWAQTGAAVSLAMSFCWLASRSRAGFKAAFLACLLLAIHHAFYFTNLRPPGSEGGGGFSVGYSFHSNLLRANIAGFSIPLLVLTVFVCGRLREKTTGKKQIICTG